MDVKELVTNGTNNYRLRVAQKLLKEIRDSWNKDHVVTYKSKLSFDELVVEVCAIELKDTIA